MSVVVSAFLEQHERHFSRGVVVDANLLLLFLVGLIDPDRIGAFKRTSTYRRQDFELLLVLLDEFQQVLTTNSILTEVSNLGWQLKGEVRLKFVSELAAIIFKAVEMPMDASRAATERRFQQFGLTDAGIFQLAREEWLILTDDFPLAGSLEREGLPVLNFAHLRVLGDDD